MYKDYIKRNSAAYRMVNTKDDADNLNKDPNNLGNNSAQKSSSKEFVINIDEKSQFGVFGLKFVTSPNEWKSTYDATCSEVTHLIRFQYKDL